MAFCTECGHQLADGAKFCYECGAKVKKTPAVQQRKMVYDGTIHKCPNCGEIIGAFMPICPTCGHEIRGSRNINSLAELVDKLEQIEVSRAGVSTKGKRLNPNELTNIDKQKINLIRNFPIPNTKEDIYEFMILAASNVNTKWWLEGDASSVAQEEESNAWMAKFEQAYQKAELMFSADNSFDIFKKLYVEKTKAARKKKMELPVIMIGTTVMVMVMMLFLVLVVKLAG